MAVPDWLQVLRFRPRLVDCLAAGYSRDDLRADAVAGLLVAIVALPLVMAFAMASGVSPQAGIVTAVIAGFLLSALGGARLQIGGPSAVYIVVAYAIVAQYGIASLVLCTVAAGVT